MCRHRESWLSSSSAWSTRYNLDKASDCSPNWNKLFHHSHIFFLNFSCKFKLKKSKAWFFKQEFERKVFQIKGNWLIKRNSTFTVPFAYISLFTKLKVLQYKLKWMASNIERFAWKIQSDFWSRWEMNFFHHEKRLQRYKEKVIRGCYSWRRKEKESPSVFQSILLTRDDDPFLSQNSVMQWYSIGLCIFLTRGRKWNWGGKFWGISSGAGFRGHIYNWKWLCERIYL